MCENFEVEKDTEEKKQFDCNKLFFALAIITLLYASPHPALSLFLSFLLSSLPPFPPLSLSPAKLFLAWEKKVFTLWPRPAGITLCSHWLNPLLPLHGLHIFPVLQDFKKGRREIKRERKKNRRVREQPPPPIICGFSLALLCVCAHGHDSCINRNTNSWTTNSSKACGLQAHFYAGHMGDCGPLSFQVLLS